ncbi:23S rRNA (uracil(1939)-C(5))-methyltransferase RlmD [Enterococcus malodoratus]|uniref:23S rRNA (Uracil-5-)-methyltransferase RumA n=1 Tax=Enterococcus malodoratus ATCC 43197 TaxID=1158601 RepID=R2PEE4_9ENTE|nr:23S rRNA (uracil(1939)-C(5))-methyltransferase RlmD [Enterococcus malodoratus]EOH82737.1 23S rRNA (uracil-5-)-methyltransferase RumA [Enterococcus malodoratus ATCC 43197]EOT70553.1 23S rRNA (uracil-5-)-methyltransferase RumA [Enterococcus malodoratus ATCC 43197]OJG64507.1 23S rRNA (uracil-5-)-methyltransferase RumA [Enterococcus malodoratus]SPW86700.1 23S rRNA (uracil-5-)-methyltransferase RumA [Enterococcus malodoratus]STC72037.1 23S rRNA (uracil-5-)-methyltransferase RumA [Enterococcus ma
MTTVEKNQTYTVTIDDLSYEGLGVAHIDGYPLFIENALPEEEMVIKAVKVGKKFGYGKVMERFNANPERQEVEDLDLLRSGIAPLSHMTYDYQLRFKKQQVENVLRTIAKLPELPVAPTLGMENPIGYRNKAQIPVQKVDNKLTTGFYRKNSHNLLPIENYLIQDPKIDQAIITIRDILQRFNVKAYNERENTGFIRHIIIRRGHYSHEMMVILVTRTERFFKGTEIAETIKTELPEVVSVIQNVNSEKTNVIMGQLEKVLFGKTTIDDTLLGRTYRISPQSFYQVNTEQTEVLYKTAIDFAELDSEDIVVDAYCGIGTIGLSLADNVKHVYGVEIVPQAIEDAKANAKANGIENANYEIGKAEKIMPRWAREGIEPSVIFVDPPRKGLDEKFIEASAAVNPEKIVYISCNPATLARDLRRYEDLGYHAVKVQPVDLFPQTYHVESVTLLIKVV